MPRNRTARRRCWASPSGDPANRAFPSRTSSALDAGSSWGILVLLALALITISFRESERRTAARRAGRGRERPAAAHVAVERVARPFRDAYGWSADLFYARDEAERLRAENEQLRSRP